MKQQQKKGIKKIDDDANYDQDNHGRRPSVRGRQMRLV